MTIENKSPPQHTAGPWNVKHIQQTKFQDACDQIVQSSSGLLIADLLCPDLRPYNAPNAYLIAAAPDLLEALIAAIPHLEKRQEEVPYTIEPLRMARAAIAKAKGGAA